MLKTSNSKTATILFIITTVIVSGCACFGGNKSSCVLTRKDEQSLKANAINNGPIPESMQWKRTTVFTAADEASPALLDRLKKLPESVTVQSPMLEPDLTTPNLYLLLGWSTGGLDELRAARLDSATMTGNEIKVWLWKPNLESIEGVMGTADMKFIGWQINPGKLSAGEYRAKLYVQHGTFKAGDSGPRGLQGSPELVKELTFRMAGE